MSSISEVISHVVQKLEGVGLTVATNPSEFWPDPVACLVGIPYMTARTLNGYQVIVPVRVVCAQWLDDDIRDQFFDSAKAAAVALDVEEFDPDGWQTSSDSELPAYLLNPTILWED